MMSFPKNMAQKPNTLKNNFKKKVLMVVLRISHQVYNHLMVRRLFKNNLINYRKVLCYPLKLSQKQQNAIIITLKTSNIEEFLINTMIREDSERNSRGKH